MTTPADPLELTTLLEAHIRRLDELQETLRQSVEERNVAEIALLKAKTKERTVRDEARMIQSQMIAAQSLLKAIPR